MNDLSMINDDTIVAPATAPGEGGIGIVRLSGSGAEKLLLKFFSPRRFCERLDSHFLYYGKFTDETGKIVDEVMAVIMRKPRSYTREDVVEIHCHGGGLLVRSIIDVFLAAGARLARPGEFTLRAFLNGRIDLTQAEAVIDLIRSRSNLASDVALSQLEGRLAQQIGVFGQVIADLLAQVEAAIDFPEEDIELDDQQMLGASAGALIADMDRIIDTFESGRVLREGLRVLIFGKPNVGKSSLMNGLLGEARAIVTDIPGTTRDTIEEDLVLGGLPLRIVDTAGIRNTLDPVEEEGVRRARSKVESADLVLLVIDGSQEMGEDDLLALEFCRNREVLVVINKCDLATLPISSALDGLPYVRTSVLEKNGLDGLVSAIQERFVHNAHVAENRETVVLTQRRHRQALVKARQSLGRFRETLVQGMSPEFGAVELRDALDAVGEITGETTPDDILERIFTRFCIGK
ncbi:tRNA (5-carboxymethylaminomethyl-U34) modification GTPase [Syntrophotalea carbinolica DSM 2380]|nr:tRNA uridine-5-carboxymethylaminomethyl(34) synthesis GTPase MnmE [Syntrophotalea carbinolica]ABA90377.1 tRNA (5-carboxymethylaminomethyl-U34) modification GTPase [Syntrophotalea carbinolica DSM 2380]